MNLKNLEKYIEKTYICTKSFPFNEVALVYKVEGKMFALIATTNNPLEISLKCEPNDAVAYREIYSCVRGGYHLNKTHWNTITLTEEMSQENFYEMINDSYNLVIKKLTKVQKEELSKKVQNK